MIAVGRVEPVQFGRHQPQARARRNRFRVPASCFRIGNVGQDHTSPLSKPLEKIDRERRTVFDSRVIDPRVIADGVLRDHPLIARNPVIGPRFARPEDGVLPAAKPGERPTDRPVQRLREAFPLVSVPRIGIVEDRLCR